MNAVAHTDQNTTHPLTKKSLDQLEQDIVCLSQHINASEYEFLVLLREFDLRQGWKAYHFNHCAEWLNMKCGMALNTAREKLRVANALFDLPAISRAFQQGDLSYSKARSLTRVATPQREGQLLDFALKALELAVAQVKDCDADYFADGVAEPVSESDGDTPRGASALRREQADALVELARAYLAGGEDRTSGSADHYQVTVHVDERALRGAPDEQSKSDLPIETIRRLCCDGAIVPLVRGEGGEPVGLGRKHRVVSPSLKRALLARDRQCRFPGCTHRKWLDAHHVVHWADGGETRADNLVMLCSAHHRLLHEGGFEIRPGANGDWQFRNASGLRQPRVGA